MTCDIFPPRFYLKNLDGPFCRSSRNYEKHFEKKNNEITLNFLHLNLKLSRIKAKLLVYIHDRDFIFAISPAVTLLEYCRYRVKRYPNNQPISPEPLDQIHSKFTEIQFA